MNVTRLKFSLIRKLIGSELKSKPNKPKKPTGPKIGNPCEVGIESTTGANNKRN